MIKIKKNVRWDPDKKPPGGNLFVLIGGWTHCFTILFSYWFSITTIKNPIVPNQKKKRKCDTNPIFLFGGVLVIGRRDDILPPLRIPQPNGSTPKKLQPKHLARWQLHQKPRRRFFLRLAGQKFTLSHFVSSMFHVLLVLSSSIPQKRNGTLWLFNIAMENGPFIAGVPINSMVIFHGYVSHNQMVMPCTDDDLSRELVLWVHGAPMIYGCPTCLRCVCKERKSRKKMSYYCKLCKICVDQGKPSFEDAHMYVYIIYICMYM